ncbi:MAG: lycopene cyclase domain-containing protein [Actinobacteria bacterium]|nr:lycopene cyclase domain-containing protein [Actinomycetota bacterium]MCA1722389.1 lycopene cyclase domain-containing protein [Actinomycetota bacterium]
MLHAVYLLVLLACLIGTAPLELVLHTRVYRRWRRLLLTLLPVFVVFTIWDVLAIRAGHWSYDPRQTSGVHLGNVPLEELLFFLVIPTCSILALEAVRSVRGWKAGDER